MRPNRFGKLFLLVGLAALSSFFTSRIVAQRKHVGSTPAQVHAASKTPTKTNLQVAKRANNGIPSPLNITAEFKFDKMTVTTAQGELVVDAKVSIQDSRDDKSYMWTLLVKNERTNEIVSCTNYKDQIFSVPSKKETFAPTFKDIVKLQPGDYQVELRLYEVTSTTDLAVLNSSHALVPQVLLANVGRATLSR